jgi:HSP20 family protein
LNPYVYRDPFSNFFDTVDSSFGRLPRRFTTKENSNVRFYEKNGHHIITIDMPGVMKSDIDLELNDDYLKVKAKRKFSNGNQESYSNYEHSFLMPNNIDTEKIKAIYETGVLKVALSKSDNSISRKIELSSSKNDSNSFFTKLFSNDTNEVNVKERNS